MSFSFYMETAQSPDFQNTIAAVSVPLECEEAEYDFYPQSGPFPEETFFHFYIFGVSTRAIEVGYSNGAMQVRIMTCSCREDFDVAFELVREIARSCNASIQPEDRDGSISVAEFDATYDDAWVDDMVKSGATFLPAMIREREMASPLTLPGPVRDFHIGDRLLGEIEAEGGDFADALFKRIRETRYVDPDQYFFHANQMAIQAEGSDVQKIIAAWGPGVDYIFPRVDYFAFIDTDHTFLAPARQSA